MMKISIVSSLAFFCFLLLVSVLCTKCTNSVPHPVTSESPSPPDQQQGGIKTMDINGDGVLDTMDAGSSSGSGFGSANVAIINGKTGEKFSIESESCFCAFRNKIDIPPNLLRPENASFKAKMEEELLPRKAAAPDPSLQWILEGLPYKTRLSNQKYFDVLVHDESFNWRPLPIGLPDIYYLEYHEKKQHSSSHYYLTYYGHNHFANVKTDTLHERYRDDRIRIVTTAHGIILEKQGQYAWVFVTDDELTGSPDKLRWASIGYMRIVNNILIFNHVRSGSLDDKIYVIDLDTGKCAGVETDMSATIYAKMLPPEKQIADDPVILEMLEEFRKR